VLTLWSSALPIGIPLPIWLGLVQILPTWQATPLGWVEFAGLCRSHTRDSSRSRQNSSINVWLMLGRYDRSFQPFSGHWNCRCSTKLNFINRDSITHLETHPLVNKGLQFLSNPHGIKTIKSSDDSSVFSWKDFLAKILCAGNPSKFFNYWSDSVAHENRTSTPWSELSIYFQWTFYMKTWTIRAVHHQFACFNRDDTFHSHCSPPIGTFLDIDTGYVKKEMRGPVASEYGCLCWH
jgi:hypothetical protein